MTTKTKTPEALRAEAEKLAQLAAEVQAEIDAQSIREYEREQAEQRKAAQTLVDTFDAAALDRDVDSARHALDQAISDQPVTQALAGYLAAQYVRNWAHVDLMGARGLLGLSTSGGRASGTTELQSLDELIISTAQRDAQRHVDAHREEQGR
ncbi:MAG: hypothetical protein WKF79_03330 [Nocardioides sp.]